MTLFLHTTYDFGSEQWIRLAARGIAVVDGEVTAVEVADDRITGLRLHTGRVVPGQAVVVVPRFVARAELLTALGLQTAEQKLGDHVLGGADVAGVGLSRSTRDGARIEPRIITPSP